MYQQESKAEEHSCKTFIIELETELQSLKSSLEKSSNENESLHKDVLGLRTEIKQLKSEISNLKRLEKLCLNDYEREHADLVNTVSYLQPYELKNKQMETTIEMLHENIHELNMMLDEANLKIPIDEKGITQYILESVGIQVFITKGF